MFVPVLVVVVAAVVFVEVVVVVLVVGWMIKYEVYLLMPLGVRVEQSPCEQAHVLIFCFI